MTPTEELTEAIEAELAVLPDGPSDPDVRARLARGLARRFEPVLVPMFTVRATCSLPARSGDAGDSSGPTAVAGVDLDVECVEGGAAHFHFEPNAAERALLAECDNVEVNLVAHILGLARQVMPGDDDARRHSFITRAIGRCGIEHPTLRDLSKLSNPELERIVDQLRKLGEAFHRGTTWGSA